MLKHLLVAVLLAVLLSGCGDDSTGTNENNNNDNMGCGNGTLDDGEE